MRLSVKFQNKIQLRFGNEIIMTLLIKEITKQTDRKFVEKRIYKLITRTLFKNVSKQTTVTRIHRKIKDK